MKQRHTPSIFGPARKPPARFGWLLHPTPQGLAAMLIMSLISLIGCTSAQQPDVNGQGHGTYPSDFKLALFVDGIPDSADPQLVTAQHIVAADRILRAATGEGCTPDLFPMPTATLSYAQMAALYQAVHASQLDTPQSAPPVIDADIVHYNAAVTANGQRYEHILIPADDPQARQLLDLLIAYRGGQ